MYLSMISAISGISAFSGEVGSGQWKWASGVGTLGHGLDWLSLAALATLGTLGTCFPVPRRR